MVFSIKGIVGYQGKMDPVVEQREMDQVAGFQGERVKCNICPQ